MEAQENADDSAGENTGGDGTVGGAGSDGAEAGGASQPIRHRRVPAQNKGIGDEPSHDVSWLVRPTRLAYRLAGLAGLAFAMLLYTEPDTSIFDYILPVMAIGLGAEGCVLRAEIAESGTLLKIHSLVKPQRIALDPGIKIYVTTGQPWWGKGLRVPCIGIKDSGGEVELTGTHGRKKRLFELVDALYESADLEPAAQ